ncbi:hypothetical protein [Rhodanobacter sp. MP1X3]|uniref:hypothetical protein n=1 Tax=Rhodanobacter sp. MP1X3 TaxID=2723086 RepID=UPI001827CC57|nr:hypothetical protein [Rhodanobacter sp. MP1X3]MBB6243885.1 hypothetical protein [Rhodanobacter sp. MP1X3]
MNTLDIANKLVDLCKQGKNDEAKALYASDAVSVEAIAMPGAEQEARGLAAIKANGGAPITKSIRPLSRVLGPMAIGSSSDFNTT